MVCITTTSNSKRLLLDPLPLHPPDETPPSSSSSSLNPRLLLSPVFTRLQQAPVLRAPPTIPSVQDPRRLHCLLL
ncbi:hypothetical protein Cob_v012794 [Colletotrichum orbiculare MAFF 240422]|uniref:Uncharacterized protein n=1 Tax=Colletotrichum orbiculare (strain 104-T / ATCC 96160 / CBS 514.97 / LARS 414 / MAFF 240422) TaxID=1213857 RepID=A0A484FA55_COLOR|nr:hypothetical protein Cob_v012794 [Colletotrichum orbiculare MAFF 240422]